MVDRKTRELLRLVLAEGASFPQIIEAHHVELIEPILVIMQHLIDDGTQHGEFRDGPSVLARIVIAPVLTLMVETLIHDHRRDLEVPRYIEANFDLIMHGLVRVR